MQYATRKTGMESNAHKMKSPHRATGLTLVELSITLAVGAILLAAAIPSFTATLHKNRIGSAESQLYTSLYTARGEAVKRRHAVSVCPSADGSSCRNDGDWSDGWLIFDNDDGNDTPAASEIIRLVDSGSLHSGIDMQADDTVENGVVFNATGDAFGSSGEFRICHSYSSAFSKAISVSASGRVSSTGRTQTDCNVGS